MLGLQYKKNPKDRKAPKSIFPILQLISFGFPLIFIVSAQRAPVAPDNRAKEIKGKPKEIYCKIENIGFGAFRSLGIFLYCNPNMFTH